MFIVFEHIFFSFEHASQPEHIYNRVCVYAWAHERSVLVRSLEVVSRNRLWIESAQSTPHLNYDYQCLDIISRYVWLLRFVRIINKIVVIEEASVFLIWYMSMMIEYMQIRIATYEIVSGDGVCVCLW